MVSDEEGVLEGRWWVCGGVGVLAWFGGVSWVIGLEIEGVAVVGIGDQVERESLGLLRECGLPALLHDCELSFCEIWWSPLFYFGSGGHQSDLEGHNELQIQSAVSCRKELGSPPLSLPLFHLPPPTHPPQQPTPQSPTSTSHSAASAPPSPSPLPHPLYPSNTHPTPCPYT